MKWLWVALAFVFGMAMAWYLTGRRQGGAAQSSPALEDTTGTGSAMDDEAAGFGGTPTPASASVGPAEAWRRDAEDEDALLRNERVEPAPPESDDEGRGA